MDHSSTIRPVTRRGTPPGLTPERMAPKRIVEPRRQESAKKDFLTDVKTLRKRARQHIERGAVTEGYSADRETVLKLLNEALATEIVCVLRYKRHYFMASGIHAQSVAAEFLAARERGAGARRPDRGAHRAARRRAELLARRARRRAATPSTSRATTWST